MKTSRQSIVKRYVKAFLKCYGSVLIPEDLVSLSSYIDVIKKHKQTIVYSCQCYASMQEKINFLMNMLDKSVINIRATLRDSFEKLISVLVYHQRVDFLFDIMFLIRIRFFNSIGYQHAHIATSHALTDEEKQDIVQSFKDITNKNIDAEYTIDSSLIAGIRIVSQDYLWEYSVAQKIKALRVQ